MTQNDVDNGDTTQCQTVLDQEVIAETEDDGIDVDEEEEDDQTPHHHHHQGGQFMEVSQLVQLVSSEADIVHMDVVAGGESVEGGKEVEMVQETELMGEVVDGTSGLAGEGQEECLIVMAE